MEEILKLADRKDAKKDDEADSDLCTDEEDVDDEPQDDYEYHNIFQNRVLLSKGSSRISNLAPVWRASMHLLGQLLLGNFLAHGYFIRKGVGDVEG